MAAFAADEQSVSGVDAAYQLMFTLFQSQPDIAYVGLVLPKGLADADVLHPAVFAPLANAHPQGSFSAVRGCGPLLEEQCVVSLCSGAALLPHLSIRKAAVEDHDDLVPVFDGHSEVISSDVGEFFLAELISQQDEDRRSVVGTAQGQAVGLMSVARHVDVHTLQEAFDLSAHNGLQRRTVRQARQEAAAARDASRSSFDWLWFLMQHASEVASLFNALTAPSVAGSGLGAIRAAQAASFGTAAHTVQLGSVAAALDVRGLAWGYAAAGGVGLGTAMLADMIAAQALPSLAGSRTPADVASVTVTREDMGMAVARVADGRETQRRRRRLADACATQGVGGFDALRELALSEFDTLQESIVAEKQVAASAAREAAAAQAAEARQRFEEEEAHRREAEGYAADSTGLALDGEGADGLAAGGGSRGAHTAPAGAMPPPSFGDEEEDGQFDAEAVKVPVMELAASISAAMSERGVQYSGEHADTGAGEELVMECARVLGIDGWRTTLLAHLDDEDSMDREAAGLLGMPEGVHRGGGISGGKGGLVGDASAIALITPEQATDRMLLEVALDRMEGVLSMAAVGTSAAADAIAAAGAEEQLLEAVEGVDAAAGAGSLLGGVVSARATRLAMACADGVSSEAEAAAGSVLAALLGVPVVHLPTVMRKVTLQLQAEAIDATEKAAAAEHKRRADEAKRRKRHQRKPKGEEEDEEGEEEDEEAAAAAAAEAAAAEALLYKGQYAAVLSVLASPLCSRGYVLTGLTGAQDLDVEELRLGFDKVTRLLLTEMELPQEKERAPGTAAAKAGSDDAMAALAAAAAAEDADDAEADDDVGVRADGTRIPMPSGSLLPHAVLLLDNPATQQGIAQPSAAAAWLTALSSRVLRVTLPPALASLTPQVDLAVRPSSAAAGGAGGSPGGDGEGDGESTGQGYALLRAASEAPSGVSMAMFGSEDASADDGNSGTFVPPVGHRGVSVDVDLDVKGLGALVAKAVPEGVQVLVETAAEERRSQEEEAAARAAAGKKPKRAVDPAAAAEEAGLPPPPHKRTPYNVLQLNETTSVTVSVSLVPDVVTAWAGASGPHRDPAAAQALVDAREQLLSVLLREGLVLQRRVQVADERRMAAAQRSGMSGSVALLRPVSHEETCFDDRLVEQEGVSNAFAISLFCLAEHFECRSSDFLPAVFALFPEAEYAVLTQPHAAAESPLLQYFSSAPARPSSTLPHALYVMHRTALGAPHTVTMRVVRNSDRMALSQFASQLAPAAFVDVMSDAVVAAARTEEALASARGGSTPLDSELACASSPAALLAEVEGQIIGVCTLAAAGCAREEVVAAASAFDIQQFLDLAQYSSDNSTALQLPPAIGGKWRTLRDLELNPLFASPVTRRTVLRRAMALTGASAIMFRQWGAAVAGAVGASALGGHGAQDAAATATGVIAQGVTAGAAGDTDPLPGVVRDMLQVAPRRMPQQRPHELPGAAAKDARLVIGSAISRQVAGAALGRSDIHPLGGDSKYDESKVEVGGGVPLVPWAPSRYGAALDPQDEAAVADTEARMAAMHARGFGYVAELLQTLPRGTVGAREESNTDLSDPRQLSHALFVTTRKLLGEPKITVNTRVVVVGASQAALSFLDSLLRVPYLRFAHLSLVSPGGMAPHPTPPAIAPPPYTAQEGAVYEPASQSVALQHGCLPLRAAPFFPFSPDLSPAALARLGLPSSVEVVDAAVAGIDRPEGRVLLADGAGALPYDLLMLAPGLAEGTLGRLGLTAADAPKGLHSLTHTAMLAALEEDVSALVKNVPFPWAPAACAESIVPPALPEGEAAAGADAEGDELHAPDGCGVASGRDVVVLGDGLEALTALSALLDRGVHPKRITFVRRSRPLIALRHGASSSEAGMGFGGASTAGEAVSAEHTEALVTAAMCALGVQQLVGWELSHVEGAWADAGDSDSPRFSRDAMLTLDFSNVLSPEQSAAEEGIATAARGETGEEGKGEEDAEEEEEEEGFTDLGMYSTDDLEGKGGEAAAGMGPQVPQSMRLDARLVVAGDRRAVDERFFNAVNDCGLVYDGRLVVNHHFCTTDPSVFAGGTVTKFSRRYRAALPMQAFNSAEVGAAAAASVLRMIDPLQHAAAVAAGDPMVLEGPSAAVGRGSHLLPEFKSAKVVSAVLPGGLHWMHGRLPRYDLGKSGRTMATHTLGQLLPYLPAKAQGSAMLEAELLAGALIGTLQAPPPSAAAAALQLTAAGAPAVATVPSSAGAQVHVPTQALSNVLAQAASVVFGAPIGRNVFLTVDRFSRLCEVSHLGGERVEEGNLASLIGQQSAMLNAAERDFDAGRISDWAKCLREDWAVAVVHDRFSQLTAELRRELLQHEDVARLVQEVRTQAEQGNVDGVIAKLRDEKVGVAGKGLRDTTRRAVEARLTSYLSANRPLLPMFFLPGHAALPTVDGKPAESHPAR